MALTAALVVASCAGSSGNWSHSELPKSQWEKDYGRCRNAAEGQVLGYGDRYDDARGGDPIAGYDRQDAKRRIDGLVAACMAGRGYTNQKR